MDLLLCEYPKKQHYHFPWPAAFLEAHVLSEGHLWLVGFYSLRGGMLSVFQHTPFMCLCSYHFRVRFSLVAFPWLLVIIAGVFEKRALIMAVQGVVSYQRGDGDAVMEVCSKRSFTGLASL
jgi:hypothetical protein